MNFKLKPLSLAVLATATVLGGCSTEEETIEKTRVFDPETNTGLWCKAPDIVQTIDADFHPLTETEITNLETVALSITDPEGEFTEEETAAFKASFNPYTFDYGSYDLYQTLGLTMEEEARKLVKKEEARTFKLETQKQGEVFGDGFDEWFDAWFETVPARDYLGKSQRLPKATLGMELSLSAANNGEEACYTPPTECPNYQVVDESGKYNCIIPEENPLAEEAPALPAAVVTARDDGKAVLFFRKNGEQNDANYADIGVHYWNNSDCTAYDGDTPGWGSGPAPTAIDTDYGAYWIFDLVDGHDSCANIIVYNKVENKKFITENDAMLPLGNSGDVIFHNLDKISYFQEGFPANLYDGAYLANQHPFFGASAGSKSCGWGTTLDEAGEACIGQELPNCPEGSYAVGEGQVDIASKCVAEFAENTQFFLRGGFVTDWGTTQPFVSYGEGEYRTILEYGDHPEGATVKFKSDAQVSVTTAAGATLTFEQPTDENGDNVDFELNLNNIPANTLLTRADGTEVTLAADSNVLVLPEGTETPAVENLVLNIPAESVLTLAAGANHGDFACMTDCLTQYAFKVADENWTEAASYGAFTGDDTITVGGSALSLTTGEGVGQNIQIVMEENSNYAFTFNAAQPDMATVEVDKVPVKAYPSLYIGNDDQTLMAFNADKYVVEGKALTAGTYQILIADVGASFTLGGETGATDLAVDSTIGLVADGEVITLTIADDGEYDFTLDYSNVEAPTLTVVKGVPYGSNDIYIRGTMTGWGNPAPASDKLEYTKSERTYSVLYGLEAGGNHNFKFASQAWGGPVDQGYSAYDYSDEGETLSDNFGNIKVTPSKSTVYEFSIDFSVGSKGVVKVAEAPIYIRGGIYGTGDWAADETMRLNFEPSNEGNNEEASHVYSSVVTTTGPGLFKIADEGWGGTYGFNYGASTAQKDAGEDKIVLGQPFVLTNNGENLNFQFPAGTYRFSLDHSTETLTVTEVME